VDSGLRFGEMMRIDGNRDIDHKHKAVTVWETKADLPRTVPLTERAYAAIKRRITTHGAHNKGKLFPYHDNWMRHTWDRMKASLELSDDDQYVIHALRHTFASRLVQRGVPIQVVQQLLGHKDIKMTMRYAHLSPVNLRDAVALLEQTKETT
jgi:site-specific recombinase XerD